MEIGSSCLERLSFLGALIEVVQNIPLLHRDCGIKEWIAETAAIAVMLVLMRVWRLRRKDGEAIIASRFFTARPWIYSHSLLQLRPAAEAWAPLPTGACERHLA